MKKQKQMQKAFGVNGFGLIDFPVKISNVQASPQSCMEMKEGAPVVSLMGGKLLIQHLSTDSETGSALEKQDGKRRPDVQAFFRYYAIYCFSPWTFLSDRPFLYFIRSTLISVLTFKSRIFG